MNKKLKIILIFILFSSFFLSSCSEKKEILEIKKSYKTDIVLLENLKNIYSYIGYSEGVNQVMLATKNPGRITFLNKKMGDKVYAGETILSLGNEEANAGYNTTLNIISSLNKLKKSTANSFDFQIEAMKKQLKKAEIGIEGTKTGLENIKNIKDKSLKTLKQNIKNAELGVETAKINLEKTNETINQNKINLIKNSKSAITNSLILYKNILEYTDIILSQTEKNKNSNKKYKTYLSARDKDILNISKENFWKTKKILEKYEIDYETNIENKNASEKTIKNSLKLGEQTAEEIKILLKNMWSVMDETIDSIGAINKQEILNHKTNFSNFGQNVESSLLTISGEYILGIKGSLQNFDSIETEKSKAISLLKKQISLAESGLETAKQNYNQYNSINSSKVDEVSTKAKIAENSIGEILAGIESLKSTKQAKLKEIDSKIAEISGKKIESLVNINNGKIISPISGVIFYKNAEKGQVINGGIPVYGVADDSNILVKIKIPDNIIENIKKGDKVYLQRESSSEKLKAKISNIASTKDQITKKTEIEIKISNKNKEIKIGEMIKVFFEIDNKKSKKNELLIPNNSIISKFMIPGVYVLENNKVLFKKIKILNSNENKTSISGLKAGEIIITDGKENIYDGEILK